MAIALGGGHPNNALLLPLRGHTPRPSVTAAHAEAYVTRGRPKLDALVDHLESLLGEYQKFTNPFVRAYGGNDGADPSMAYAQKRLVSMVLAFNNTLDWLSMDTELAACMPRAPWPRP